MQEVMCDIFLSHSSKRGIYVVDIGKGVNLFITSLREGYMLLNLITI